MSGLLAGAIPAEALGALGLAVAAGGAWKIRPWRRAGTPRLSISPEGIVDHGQDISLRWEEIRAIEPWPRPLFGRMLVRVTLTDPDGFLRARGWVYRFATRLNRWLGGAEVTISLTGLDRKPGEVVRLMEEMEGRASIERVKRRELPGRDGRAHL